MAELRTTLLASLTHTVPTIGAPAAAVPLIVSDTELAEELETLETLELETLDSDELFDSDELLVIELRELEELSMLELEDMEAWLDTLDTDAILDSWLLTEELLVLSLPPLPPPQAARLTIKQAKSPL